MPFADCADLFYPTETYRKFCFQTGLQGAAANAPVDQRTMEKPLLNNLMLASNTTTIDFSKYFAKCNPKACTYIVTSTRPAADVLTAVLGIIGGVQSTLAPLLGLAFQKFRTAGAV